MFRVEDKFLCSERDMLILESRVKVILRPDAYAGKPSYQVTSLYFDNREDTLWRDAEDGVSFRNRGRIRPGSRKYCSTEKYWPGASLGTCSGRISTIQ